MNSTMFHARRLLFCLGIGCGILSVLYPETVSSQTTDIRLIRVVAKDGTTFKQRENWYQQSSNISDDKKCYLRQGDKFFVAYIIKNIKNSPMPPKGNSERIGDYWEVAFEKPLPCNLKSEGKQNWFVYKSHVQELKTVVVR